MIERRYGLKGHSDVFLFIVILRATKFNHRIYPPQNVGSVLSFLHLNVRYYGQ